MEASRLQGFSLIAGLSANQVQELADSCTAMDVAAGCIVVRQGTEGGDLFLLEKGEVEVIIESSDERHGIARLQAGSFFGEVGLLNPGKRTASIMTTRPSKLIVLRKHVFDQMVADGSVMALRLAHSLGQTVAQRMRSTSRFVQRVLGSHEEDYRRPMSGMAAPLDTQEVTGHLPIKHALSLELDDLQKLLDGELLAIRIPTWYPRWLCEKIVRRLLKHPGFARYLMAEDVGVQRIGMTLFETENDEAMLDVYYEAAQETMWSIRKYCFPYLTPIERLRLELDELWPQGAFIESLHGRKMLSGIARMFEDAHSLPPHQDVLARDVPDSPRATQQKCQLAMNCYIRAPREGGELELWDIDPSAEEFEKLRDGRYDFLDRNKLPPSAAKITPGTGELLLMRSDRVHAVHPSIGGPRVAMSCFIGYSGPGKALTTWS